VLSNAAAAISRAGPVLISRQLVMECSERISCTMSTFRLLEWTVALVTLPM
jgi:hypothetical protein